MAGWMLLWVACAVVVVLSRIGEEATPEVLVWRAKPGSCRDLPHTA
jgi:hypothetical protein